MATRSRARRTERNYTQAHANAVAWVRSRGGWGLPDCDHAVWAAVQQEGCREGQVAARIFSCEQDDSLVGDCTVDRVGGDFDADDYLDSGCGVCGELWFPAGGDWVHAGAGGGGSDLFAE